MNRPKDVIHDDHSLLVAFIMLFTLWLYGCFFGDDAWWSFQRMWCMMIHSLLIAFNMLFILWLCGYFVEMMFDDPFKKGVIHGDPFLYFFPLYHLHYNYIIIWWKWCLMILSKRCDSWWSILWLLLFHYTIYIITMILYGGNDVWWYFKRVWFRVIHSLIICLPLCYLHYNYVFLWRKWCLMILWKWYDSWWSILWLFVSHYDYVLWFYLYYHINPRARLAPRFGNKNARFRTKTQKAICLALHF